MLGALCLVGRVGAGCAAAALQDCTSGNPNLLVTGSCGSILG